MALAAIVAVCVWVLFVSVTGGGIDDWASTNALQFIGVLGALAGAGAVLAHAVAPALADWWRSCE